mmetsp:Transcript_22485/g.59410  ORF Transcript_22485/g.59410 Transcript_22485/m.59410 type:complete len:92 (-) Transcript_22485:97-372(-)
MMMWITLTVSAQDAKAHVGKMDQVSARYLVSLEPLRVGAVTRPLSWSETLRAGTQSKTCGRFWTKKVWPKPITLFTCQKAFPKGPTEDMPS